MFFLIQEFFLRRQCLSNRLYPSYLMRRFPAIDLPYSLRTKMSHLSLCRNSRANTVAIQQGSLRQQLIPLNHSSSHHQQKESKHTAQHIQQQIIHIGDASEKWLDQFNGQRK